MLFFFIISFDLFSFLGGPGRSVGHYFRRNVVQIYVLILLQGWKTKVTIPRLVWFDKSYIQALQGSGSFSSAFWFCLPPVFMLATGFDFYGLRVCTAYVDMYLVLQYIR